MTDIEKLVSEEFEDHIRIVDLMRDVNRSEAAEKVRVIYKRLQDTLYPREMADAFGSGNTEELIRYHSFYDTVELYTEWLNEEMDKRRDALRDEMEDEK